MKQHQITSFFKNGSKSKIEFSFQKGKEIIPNEEQKLIIYEDKASHMQIKACAGSGKTTTILCRIKYLIEIEKINPARILITAFNIDAAKNVKQKLVQLVSEKVEKQITVNNIDKLSKQWVSQAKKFDVNQLSVREYTTKVVQLLNSDKSFRDKITAQFDYIFFDEFQDINPDEYELLKIFALEKTVITIVGDDAQNIYGFRESKVDNSATILTDFPNIKQLFLTTNYRSTDQIVQFANQIISCSKQDYGYKMQMVSFPPNNTGNNELPDFTKFISISEQNQAIISHIKELAESGHSYNQIAVLSRTNKPLQFLEEALEMHNNQKEKSTKQKADVITIDDIQDSIKSQTNYNTNGVIPFVAHITDNKEKQAKVKFKSSQNISRVTLTTIHKSKGLEWDIVFLIGLNDDYFPGTNKEKEQEEERRVFYVGVTRAKKKLLMSFVWSKANQNMSRFVVQISTKLYTGYTQPLISEQQKCNEKMRTIDKIKSNTIILTEIIEFLTKEHYEQLRNLGCLDLKRETIQIHFKCNLGQYILENNLVPEFATFFKCYLIRSIGEEYTAMISGIDSKEWKQSKCTSGKESKYVSGEGIEQDAMAMAYNNKYCLGVLLSESALNSVEQNEVSTLQFVIDKNILSTQYIHDQNKREEMLLSLIAFKDRYQNSDNILRHIYNVAMCQSIYNQRRRLLHKDDAFKHFEFNKNILRNAKRSFIPEMLKNPHKSVQVNQTVYDESFQMKAEYDVIADDTIFEIRFQQTQLHKPEDSIELLAKAAIIENAWKDNKIKYLCIYYPLQGELTTIDISQKESQLQNVLKILYQSRQDKQDACSVHTKSLSSSIHTDSQLNFSQQQQQQPKYNTNESQDIAKSLSIKQLSDESFSSQSVSINQNKKKELSLFDKYGEEEDLFESNQYYDYVPQKTTNQTKNKLFMQSSQSSESQRSYQNNLYSQEIHKVNSVTSHYQNNQQNNQNRSKSSDDNQSQNNFGFVRASDIANIKTTLQDKKHVSAQQKCLKELSISSKFTVSQFQKPQQQPKQQQQQSQQQQQQQQQRQPQQYQTQQSGGFMKASQVNLKGNFNQ